MKTFDFRPTDTIFCRDSRPIAAGNSYGRGARWPLPTVLHGAIRTALLKQAGCLPTGKKEPKTPRFHGAESRNEGSVGATAFDWLHIHGPFPVKDGTDLFFPLPLDLVASGQGPAYKTLKLIPLSAGGSDLDAKFLEWVPACFETPSKQAQEARPDWVCFSLLERYLAGEVISPVKEELWSAEHRIGVAIDPSTHAGIEGQLYGTEHLRLRDNVMLRFSVSEPPSHVAHRSNGLHATPEDLVGTIVQLGGEQRFGTIQRSPEELSLPSVEIKGCRVKWVLLTAAIFAHGWHPGWIEDGGVKLRLINRETRRELRHRRRERGWEYHEEEDPASPISARLVAACVGKPLVISGWEVLQDDRGGARPTRLAVPPGSVFYFEADCPEEASKLVKALQGRCRSDYLGEKGLGLGVCGTWEDQVKKFPKANTQDQEV